MKEESIGITGPEIYKSSAISYLSAFINGSVVSFFLLPGWIILGNSLFWDNLFPVVVLSIFSFKIFLK